MATAWADDSAAHAADMADEFGESITLRFDDGTSQIVKGFVDRNSFRQDDRTGAVIAATTLRIPRADVPSWTDGDQAEIEPIRGSGKTKRYRIMRPVESTAWWFVEVQA